MHPIKTKNSTAPLSPAPAHVSAPATVIEHKPGCMFSVQLAKNFSCVGTYEGMKLYAMLVQSEISKLPELTLGSGNVTVHTAFNYCPECGAKL